MYMQALRQTYKHNKHYCVMTQDKIHEKYFNTPDIFSLNRSNARQDTVNMILKWCK